MALSINDLKAQLNITGATDDAILARLLSVATKRIERHLGFELTNTEKLPSGAPADLEHAVYLTAAHFYENREATLVGVSAEILPFGVIEILADYRDYTFGLADEETEEGDDE